MTQPSNGTEVKPIEPARKIAIVGEIPFCGSAVAKALVRGGLGVKVLSPDESSDKAVLSSIRPEEASSIEIVRGTLDSPQQVAAAFNGAYAAAFLSPINLTGRIYRAARHLDDVRRIVEAAQSASLRKLVYHSSLAAHLMSQSETMRVCGEAEELIHASRCEDFRIRTGPVMGRGDRFLTEIIRAIQAPSPIMGVLGYGSTMLQPIHVEDLGRCVAKIFSEQPELRPGAYPLAGPEMMTFLEVVDGISDRLGRMKLKFHAPLFVLKLLASMRKGEPFSEKVEMLFDNFCTDQNEAPKLLGSGRRLLTIREAQDEILASQAASA